MVHTTCFTEPLFISSSLPRLIECSPEWRADADGTCCRMSLVVEAMDEVDADHRLAD